MRIKKIRSVYEPQTELGYPLITEPNQSFTPRQIIDQFSRGELSAKSFDPSDSIDDDSYSDDVMVDNIIDFEDEFSALEFMKTTKVKRNKKEDVARSEDDAKVKRNKKEDVARSEDDAKEGKTEVSEGSSQQET